jgi:hypothetical protein
MEFQDNNSTLVDRKVKVIRHRCINIVYQLELGRKCSIYVQHTAANHAVNRPHSLLDINRHNLLTYSMKQSPSWEANRFSANQEILRILWNPKVYYRIHNCQPPVSILSQLSSVHSPTSYFLKNNLNNILPSTHRYLEWYLSLRFPHQNPLYNSTLYHACYMLRPTYHQETKYNQEFSGLVELDCALSKWHSSVIKLLLTMRQGSHKF